MGASKYGLDTKELHAAFYHEAAELLEKIEKETLKLADTPGDTLGIHAMFRAAHMLKGSASFLALTEVGDDCARLEEILNNCRKGFTAPNEAFRESVLRGTQDIRAKLKPLQADTTEKANSLESAAQTVYKPLGKILLDMKLVSPSRLQQILQQQRKGLGELLVEAGELRPEDLEKALKLQKTWTTQDAEPTRTSLGIYHISQRQLDHIQQELQQLEINLTAHTQEAAAASVQRIQAQLKAVQKVPITALAHRLELMVNRLARQLRKKVRFEVFCAKEELDAELADIITKPLIHMLRNALDHGIEPAIERGRKGKSETAILTLHIRIEALRIELEVRDDGRGLDTEAILRQAKERSMSLDDTIENDPYAIQQLIFCPGFSTRTENSELSGRGYGLDIAGKIISDNGGSIRVFSQEGSGCRFVIELPIPQLTQES